MEQELEDVVQAERVADRRGGDRQQVLEIVSPDVRAQLPLPGAHPQPVAPDRVDLAVVRQQTEGLGERPRRQGVGGEALVEHRHLRPVALVGEIEVEALQLAGRHESLVDEGLRRQRADVGVALLRQVSLDAPAQQVEPRFHRPRVALGTGDEELQHPRHAGPGHLSENVGTDRHLAVPEIAHPESRRPPIDRVLQSRALPRRGEDHRHGQNLAGFEPRADLVFEKLQEEVARQVGHEPRAVPGLVVGASCAAVHQPPESGESQRHDAARRHAGGLCDEAGAAGGAVRAVD